MQEMKQIPIEKIMVGEHEQRLDADDAGITELAASIARIGVVSPLVVSADGDSYTIIAGHRRFVAARKAGCGNVPCIVRACEKEVEAEITFAENFFRSDLSAVELACALNDCLNNKTMTVEELAAGFHRSVHWVNSMVAIAGWPADVQVAIHNEAMSVSAGSNLACVTDNEYRSFLVRNAVEQGATARTTAAWLQAWRANQPQEEAIIAEPVPGQTIQIPAVPQAPCFLCSNTFAVNEMSHLPICGGCIQTIRQAGMS